jgi:hypothetical protein
MSVVMWNLCTELCVKNRWWTSGSCLGLCPNSPVKASKIVVVYTVVWFMCPMLNHVHVKCIHTCTPLWEMWLEVIHVTLFFLCWRCGLSMLHVLSYHFVEVEVYVYHMWVEDLMLLSCILHTSSFAWKFCRDHMVWPYRYTQHHTLPEDGYDAASYPRGMKAEVITASVAICIQRWSVEPVVVKWIVWVFTWWFTSLKLNNWLLVYLLQINTQEGTLVEKSS